LYSDHAGCLALAIKEKYEKKAPPPCEREKAVSLSLSFPLLPSLLDLFSNKKTRQKKIVPSVGIEPLKIR
jgi:hypothetical protein